MNEQIEQLIQVLKIREQAVHQAFLTWQQARDQFQANKAQHDQLVEYRQDYVNQLHLLGNSGCEVGRLRNRIDFIAQLDKALIQLSQHLAGLAKQRSHYERLYLKAKSEQDVVIQLLEKLHEQQKAEQDRLEQKESDEYALKQWYSKSSITNTIKRSD